MAIWDGSKRVMVLLGLSVFLTSCGEPTAPEPERWNVLIVTTDTLRADRLGVYGYDRPTSPFLDDFATQSVVFERAVSSSAVTPVSHASLFTGLYPYRHGLRSLHGGVDYALSKDIPTLATRLVDEGYSTAGFVSAFPATRHYGLHQGFETWDEEFDSDSQEPVLGEDGIVNTGKAQRRGDLTTESCLNWLKQEAGSPFFAWVHYFDVHDPMIRAPDEFLSPFPPASQNRADILRSIYDGETRFVDTQISKLVRHLQEQGLQDKTIVLVISDHGEGLGDHQWWGHAILYEEQIRLPWVMRIPGLSPQRVDETVRSVDLLPTVLDYLGIAVPGDLDGRSVRAILEGGESAPRETYSESINDLSGYQGSPWQEASIYSVSRGAWKFITWRKDKRDGRLELFNLESDPKELRNLAGVEIEIRDRFRQRLESLGAIVDERPPAQIDEATRARLKALGYIK